MPMRSFLSPGEINYRRHRGRHITRAFEVGVNPDLLHLVKHTGKKNPRWRCHVCQQQCYDASDYKKSTYTHQGTLMRRNFRLKRNYLK